MILCLILIAIHGNALFFSHRDTEAQTKEIIFTKPFSQDFPGGLMVKNLPENAGDTGSIPALGRFHICGKLGPRATTTEPMLHSKRSHFS